jgi:hypothetical protein
MDLRCCSWSVVGGKHPMGTFMSHCPFFLTNQATRMTCSNCWDKLLQQLEQIHCLFIAVISNVTVGNKTLGITAAFVATLVLVTPFE